MKRLCEVGDCERTATHGRWCGKHYQRWKAHGDPLKTLRSVTHGTELERFWAKVDKQPGADSCWLWKASTKKAGHGQFRAGGTMVLAHKYLWELENGPVPDGLELDHTCRVPRCVRPSHLEPVTHRVNVLRGIGISRTNADKTRCPAGHRYDERARKGRSCRQCRLERKRAYYRRHRDRILDQQRTYRQQKKGTAA